MTLKNGRQLLSLFVGMTAATALIAGCGNFNQDPLAGKLNAGDELRKPGNDQQKPRERVPSDALVIDAPDYINYKEEVDGGPKPISGRVLIPVGQNQNPKIGQDFDVEITNINDFKGAKYDQVKGQFTWTPPKETVTDLSREMDLNVSLTTRGRPVLQRDKLIKVYITRGETIPEIQSVDGLIPPSGRIKEGERHVFTVRVVDADSTESDPPKILIMSARAGGQGTIGQAISVLPGSSWDPNPVRDPQDKRVWKFKMLLNLENQEVTAGVSTFSFDTIAVSRFGKVSAPKTSAINVYTNVSQPVCSLSGVVEIPGGVQSILNFTVQDPKGEGKVGVTFSRCGGTGAQCKCTPQTWKNSIQSCTMTWTPAQVSWPTDYPISATTSNTNPSDQTSVAGTCAAQIRVIRGSTPAPTVAPEPTAPTEPERKQSEKPRKRRSRE